MAATGKPGAIEAAPNRVAITACVVLATVMQALDTTIANVSLPYIQGSVAANQDEIEWVLTSYIVAAAIITQPTGFLAERFGVKRLFLTSIVGFTIASMLCGMAHSLVEIVLFRLIQGAFGAGLVPLSQAVLMNIYPKERQGSAMAYWGMAIMIGPIIGPVLYLQDLMGYPILTAGFALAPRGLGTLVAMTIVGRFVGRLDTRVLLAIGLGRSASVMWDMTSWTPNVSERTVGLNGIIQGAGMGFLFVPLSGTALGTLAPEQRTAGAGFFTLARNIGQSMGASVTSALLLINTQENHAEIGGHVTAVNRLFENPAVAHLWSPFTAAGRAALDAAITLQAQIIAYIDDFKLLMILTLLALPLLMIFKTPSSSGADHTVGLE
jgi:MFS family permease